MKPRSPHSCYHLPLPLQLVDNAPLFKAAEGETPLVLLPGRPPARLSLDAPLGATGAVKDGQKHVSRIACFAVAAQACSKAAAGCWPGAGRGDDRRAGAGGQVWAAAGSAIPPRAAVVVSWSTCCPRPHADICLPRFSPPILQVKLAVAFQDVELLPSRSIGAVPAGDNPALLRCVAHGLNIGWGLGDGCLSAGRGDDPALLRCAVDRWGSGAAGTGSAKSRPLGQLPAAPVHYRQWLRARSMASMNAASLPQAAQRVPTCRIAMRNSPSVPALLFVGAGRPLRSRASATFRRQSRATWCCWSTWSSR